MQKDNKARPINNVNLFNAQVDIIIPYHGQYAHLTTLIESITKLTRSNYYKLYLVDDCSPNQYFGFSMQKNADASAAKLKREKTITVIRNETQLGFGASCKVGFDKGESPYVCFMHSDCRVEEISWLKNLGTCLLNLKSSGVRVVAPQTNNPVDGDTLQYREKDRAAEVDPHILGDDSYLSLYCFLCHRDLFKKIGGFLKPYPYGGYEDQEFAHRLRKFGYKQAVCTDSWVHHEGQLTTNAVRRNNPTVSQIMDENEQRCIEDIRSLVQQKT